MPKKPENRIFQKSQKNYLKNRAKSQTNQKNNKTKKPKKMKQKT